jgi:predicted NUDIX family NTP pyrophosphohydrolase
MASRRAFLGAVGAVFVAGAELLSGQRREPKSVTVYLVRADLKCTAVQARLVEDVLRNLGQAWGHLPAYPEDWRVSKKVLGAWEE